MVEAQKRDAEDQNFKHKLDVELIPAYHRLKDMQHVAHPFHIHELDQSGVSKQSCQA